jgi:hypothetical protein
LGDAGQGEWDNIMHGDDESYTTNQIPNGLTFSQEQVNLILGHALRSVYQDLLKAPMPEYLKTLLDQLDERHSPPKDPGD